jgi:hypothetical protein
MIKAEVACDAGEKSTSRSYNVTNSSTDTMLNLKVVRFVSSLVRVKQTRYAHMPEILLCCKATTDFFRRYSYAQM